MVMDEYDNDENRMSPEFVTEDYESGVLKHILFGS
jgi:hypothetical protein